MWKPCRESYSWEHYERLRRFEYRRPFDTREKVRCVDVHPRTVPKCARCTTCHFCRRVPAFLVASTGVPRVHTCRARPMPHFHHAHTPNGLRRQCSSFHLAQGSTGPCAEAYLGFCGVMLCTGIADLMAVPKEYSLRPTSEWLHALTHTMLRMLQAEDCG